MIVHIPSLDICTGAISEFFLLRMVQFSFCEFVIVATTIITLIFFITDPESWRWIMKAKRTELLQLKQRHLRCWVHLPPHQSSSPFNSISISIQFQFWNWKLKLNLRCTFASPPIMVTLRVIDNHHHHDHNYKDHRHMMMWTYSHASTYDCAFSCITHLLGN